MKISRQDLLKIGFATAVAGVAGAACSSDPATTGSGTGGGASKTGGASGVGGGSGTGGAKSGGASGTGGAKSGGASGTGGATSGGASGTGGATSGGASSGSGGAQGGGGKCTAAPVITMDKHTHPVTVPLADVVAGAEKTYMLEAGATGHTHMMTVTAPDFTTLKTTGTVDVMSTLDSGHMHKVTLKCGA